MSARDRLITALASSWATTGCGRYETHETRAKALVDEALREHAHELAEQIRNAPMAVGFEDGMWEAADLIDPEVP